MFNLPQVSFERFRRERLGSKEVIGNHKRLGLAGMFQGNPDFLHRSLQHVEHFRHQLPQPHLLQALVHEFAIHDGLGAVERIFQVFRRDVGRGLEDGNAVDGLGTVERQR